MRYVFCLVLLFVLQFTLASGSEANRSLKFLQINIWSEGTSVENGFDDIVNTILQTDPDIVLLSEVRNYGNSDFIGKLCASLSAKGKIYYGRKSYSSGLISKFPITDQQVLYPWKDDNGSITKAIIKIDSKLAVLYSLHLDYKYYGPYLPRGYDGLTWEKLPAPVIDVNKIIQFNDSSNRSEQIETLIRDASIELKKGKLVFIGGDFNEPSHLDWVNSTRDLYDHQGLVIPWTCTKKLDEASFVDAFRKKYPDPYTHPGFTYPSDNPKAPVSQLAWAPTADDRDRIDFIFYYKNPKITLKDVFIVGPVSSIVNGMRVIESLKHHFIVPESGWPSDHKAIIAIFDLE